MGRIVFDLDSWQSFIEWLQNTDMSKYVCYITKDYEVIFRPVVDPKSRDFAYIKLGNAFDKFNKEVSPILAGECKIYQIKRYDWKIDMLVMEE